MVHRSLLVPAMIDANELLQQDGVRVFKVPFASHAAKCGDPAPDPLLLFRKPATIFLAAYDQYMTGRSEQEVAFKW